MASRGVNKVILVGNIGKDPESKYMPNGNMVVNFALATSEAWKDKNSGEQKELTEWHRCVAFGKLAEIIAEYVRKGSKLYCEGSLKTRSWDQDGITRYATEIVINEMQMLDSKPGGQNMGHDEARVPMNQQQRQAPQQAPAGDPFDDSLDVPF